MARKYRVVEMRPGVFAVQCEGLLWGWNYVISLMTEFPIEFPTEESARRKMREWEAIANHVERICE